MRDPERITRILDKVRNLWEKYPDMRLGQLLDNYGFSRREIIERFTAEKIKRKESYPQISSGPVTPLIFYLEDDELEANLDENIKALSAKPEG